MNSIKKVVLAFGALLFAFTLSAQNSSTVTFFSEDGLPFWVVIDGQRMNDAPAPRVVVPNITQEYCRVKIIFSDEKIKDISQMIQNVDVDNKRVNSTYVMKRNKKGEIVMRLSSFEDARPTTTATTTTTIQQQTPPASTTTTSQTNTNSNTGVNVNVKTDGMDQDTETISQTTTMQVDGFNFGTNVNADGQNIGMNINISGIPATTTSTTTTTTTTSSSSSTNVRNNQQNTTPAVQRPVETAKPAGCVNPVTNDQFQRGLSSVQKASFADEKLKIAKQFTKNNCLNVNQILQMMKSFSFEESKLDYAKYAYDFCTEKGNYFMVNDGLTFSSSKDDLNEFLESK